MYVVSVMKALVRHHTGLYFVSLCDSDYINQSYSNPANRHQHIMRVARIKSGNIFVRVFFTLLLSRRQK